MAEIIINIQKGYFCFTPVLSEPWAAGPDAESPIATAIMEEGEATSPSNPMPPSPGTVPLAIPFDADDTVTDLIDRIDAMPGVGSICENMTGDEDPGLP